jgi:hypothetical protein
MDIIQTQKDTTLGELKFQKSWIDLTDNTPPSSATTDDSKKREAGVLKFMLNKDVKCLPLDDEVEKYFDAEQPIDDVIDTSYETHDSWRLDPWPDFFPQHPDLITFVRRNPSGVIHCRDSTTVIAEMLNAFSDIQLLVLARSLNVLSKFEKALKEFYRLNLDPKNQSATDNLAVQNKNDDLLPGIIFKTYYAASVRDFGNAHVVFDLDALDVLNAQAQDTPDRIEAKIRFYGCLLYTSPSPRDRG